MPDRRVFIQQLSAATLAAQLEMLYALEPSQAPGEIPTRLLGKTGVRISALGLGGFHIGIPSDPNEGIRLIHHAIDNGITFMDNCWDYHDGESERRMGRALKQGGYRQKVFLMTKIDGQVKDAAARQIDQSLGRLQTDHLDLLQFHEVIRPGDPDRILGPGGGMEAALAAQKAGKIRFIGFTGHKDPSIHLKMLRASLAKSVPLASVQMPINVMDAHYRSFLHQVVPVAHKHGIGVLGMKPICSGLALESGVVSAPECLRFALSQPTSVVITGCQSMKDVDQALSVGRSFKQMSAQETAQLLDRTRSVAATGKFEPFKNTEQFDATNHDPSLLG